MKKILSIFALLMTIVIGAKAADESAILYWESTQSKANSIQIGDFTLAITGNTGKDWSNGGGDITIGSTSYKTLKNSNGAQNTITCPDGYVATGITFYVTTNADSSGKLTEIDGTACEDVVTSCKDYNNPTVISKDIDNKESFTFTFSTKQVCFVAVVTYKSSTVAGPTITTQPQDADYVINSENYPSMSVVAEVSAGTLSYAWEYSPNGETFYEIPTTGEHAVPSAATATLLGSEALAVLTIDEPTTYYFKCKVTDSNGSVYTDVATLNVIAGAPTITTDLEAAYNVNKGSSIDLSIVAEGASSYQWYVDGAAVEGATSDSYTFTAGSTIGATNAVYCAAINAAGATNSATATITTVGRADCELTNIKFSNDAYGAINNPVYTENTIAVPYMAGTEAPTVVNSSVVVSDGATFAVDGNTLTVTAEDGTTNKEYTIEAVEITPLEVTADASASFTEVPSWVFNLYGYDNDKGLKFAKAVNDASNMRIAKGNTRQYYFIGAAKSLTLTKKGSTRKVNVYVNGTKVISDTDNDALGTIALDETAPNLVIVEAAAGTNGDGGFSAYAIEAVPASQNITVGETGFATVGLPFATTVPEGVTAYAVESVAGSKVKMSAAIEAGTTIPANKGFVIVAAPNTYTFTEVATAEYEGTDLLEATGATAKTATTTEPIYVLYITDATNKKIGFKKATTGSLGAYKAYLPGTVSTLTSLSASFDDDPTAVDAIAEANEADAEAPVKVIKGGKLFIGNYNVAGARVK